MHDWYMSAIEDFSYGFSIVNTHHITMLDSFFVGTVNMLTMKKSEV